MEQNVNAAAALAQLFNYAGHGFRVGKVDTEVVRSAAGGSHSIDGTACCLSPFEGRQFLFHQSWRRSLAACLDASEQVPLQRLFVEYETLQVGVVRIRLAHHVEQIESSSGGCG